MPSVAEAPYENREAWSASAPAVVRVALAGCGAVGSALLRELEAQRDGLAFRHGLEVQLTRVLVRDVARPRDARFDAGLLTSDVNEFLATEADVVIEAIGGLDPARQIAESVLGKGRRLVTANKALLATHGTSLTELARTKRTSLRFDAAVGGGVPVLRVLEDALGAGGPVRVRGILNGTANFVLTRVEAGATLESALEEARAAGFAEADASRDLDGRDAADKIALVAWSAFGVPPEQVQVRRSSLLPHLARFVRLAERTGSCVRQVAECLVSDDGLVASVEPVLVHRDSALAHVRDEGNHVDVFTGWRAPLCASGPGAGGLPTATALLSDLVCTSRTPLRRAHGRSAAADTRRVRWALEIVGAAAELHRHVPSCGIVHTDERAITAWTVVEDATPAEIGRLAAALDEGGVHPIAARLEA